LQGRCATKSALNKSTTGVKFGRRLLLFVTYLKATFSAQWPTLRPQITSTTPDPTSMALVIATLWLVLWQLAQLQQQMLHAQSRKYLRLPPHMLHHRAKHS
jgi:hypothetical protein